MCVFHTRCHNTIYHPVKITCAHAALEILHTFFIFSFCGSSSSSISSIYDWEIFVRWCCMLVRGVKFESASLLFGLFVFAAEIGHQNQLKVRIKFIFAVCFLFYLVIGGSILGRWRANCSWNCNVYTQRSMLNAVRNNWGSPSGKRKWEPIFHWIFLFASKRLLHIHTVQAKIIMCVAGDLAQNVCTVAPHTLIFHVK